jgi:hypothetical protein
VAAAVVLVACGGQQTSDEASAARASASATGWATKTELLWLRRTGAWVADLVAADARVDDIAARVNADAALFPLARCNDTLQTDVGPAPTRRLRPAAQLLRHGCGELRRASIEAMTIIRTGHWSRWGRVRRRAAHGYLLLQQGLSHLPPAELRPLPSGAPAAGESRIVPRLGQVAARLASRPRVVVRCWSRHDWRLLIREEREISIGHIDALSVGVTSLIAHRINMRGDICLRLASLAAGHRAHREFLDAFALLVLAHESQHAAGIAGEAAAECRGMQTMVEAGALLGVPRSYARRLAQDFWAFYPRRPRPYYSRACRDGGALDMRPASHRWP